MHDINDYHPAGDRETKSDAGKTNQESAANKLATALTALANATKTSKRRGSDEGESQEPAMKAATVEATRKLAAKLVAEGKTADAVFVLRTLPNIAGQ